MKSIFLCCGLAACLLASCDQPKSVGPAPAAPAPAAPAVTEAPWISGDTLGDWQPLDLPSQAKVNVENGELHLGRGDGVSGVKYIGKRPIPVVDYELTWEGKKVDGVDFFAAVTFPVRDLSTCATFINGGWGGGVTGISCIDDLAANENNTTALVTYEDGKWYRFRLQVSAEMMTAYVDDKQVLKTLIKDKKISLRSGDIEACAPFGFASYMTKGAVRNIQFRKLAPGELKPDPDTF
jgi:hypothetical protein